MATRPQGGQSSAGVMMDPYEAFKRKHLSQNREIIHKNSELTKSNADLQRRGALLRAENLSLKSAHFQLEVEAAGLRDKLERAEHRLIVIEQRLDREKHRRAGSLDDIQAQAVRNVLLQALAAYDNLIQQPNNELEQSEQSLNQLPSPTSSLSEPLPPPPAEPAPNVAISRRRSIAARSARPSLSTRPDLSHISEDADGNSEAEAEDAPPQQPNGWGVLEGLREESSQGSLSNIWSTNNNEPASPSPAEGPSPKHSPVQEEEEPAPAAVAVRRGARSSWATQRSTADDPEPARPVKAEPRKPKEVAAPSVVRLSKGKGKQVDEALDRERRALKEVQREEQLPQRRRRTIIRAPSSSDSEDDSQPAAVEVEEEEEEQPPSAQAPALDDSSAAEESDVASPPKPKPRARPRQAQQLIAPTSPEQRVETVSGSAGRQVGPRKVKPLEIVSEEQSSRRASTLPAEGTAEDGLEGGRRARKSVNYALPKLNTKMRKPEDYVGFSTTSVAKGPRKSTVPRAPKQVGSLLSGAKAPLSSSSQPERPPTSAHSVPPRSSSSQPIRSSKAVDSDEVSSDDEVKALAQIKARRASSIAASRALKEMKDADEKLAKHSETAAGRRYSAFA